MPPDDGGGMENLMKKADILLGLSVIAVCAVIFFLRFSFQKEGASVIIEIDGENFGTYRLADEQEIDTGKGNRILIENGTVRMIEADCPDHLCVKQGEIKADGEMIVCLPNKVIVRVSDEAAAEEKERPDVIAN